MLAKFPDETHILDVDTPNARPNPVSLRNDDNFRYDCARYCENIELGRHDEEWLRQAWEAHEKHKRGDFDAFLRGQFEEDWDTELPEESNAEKVELAGSKQSLPESVDSSGLETQETPASRQTSGRSFHSPRPAAPGDSFQDLQRSEEDREEDRNLGDSQPDPTCIVMGSSGAQAPPSISRPTTSRADPPEASQTREESASTIAIRSE